jgi:CheY-like chemotaxis protein
MKILVVEDDAQYVRNIQFQLSSIRGDIRYTFARSLTSAETMLRNGFYDLIILDLKIPTSDELLDAEPEHGHLAFEHARHYAPGTPVVVLTGSSAEPFLDKLLENTNQVDLWGNGKLRNVYFLPKHKFGSSFAQAVSPYISGYSAIMDVELQGELEEIGEKDSRLIRIFCNGKKAVKCSMMMLSGGLSGAKVIRLSLTDASGAPLFEAVAKIGSKDDVSSESARFDNHIVRLNGAATPRKLALIEYGAGERFGVFYSLAAGHETNAFALALVDDDVSESVVFKIRDLTQPWREGVPESRKLVHEIRLHALSDEKLFQFRDKIPLPWIEEFEQRRVQIKVGCCHGDLHGFNVLATRDGSPILIDYGDVGHASASWDAVTLELSLIFHKDGPLHRSEWPSLTQARQWGNLDIYLVGCPVPKFIRACRFWAYDASAGGREVAACAYAYLMRQMKYEDTDNEKAFALMEGAKALFEMG